MNYLEISSKIDAEKLDQEHYFEALLQAAYSVGLLQGCDIENAQLACISILAKQTERYNNGAGSSIQIETAQGIMTSIMYTIGIALKAYENADAAAAAIANEEMEELFQKGLKRISIMRKGMRSIHAKLEKDMVNCKNEFYIGTITDGFEAFFKRYYPDFSAQETHISADYPILNPMAKLTGIEFVQAYLTSIYYENLFCSYFKAEEIQAVLVGCDANGDELMLNIYEPILTCALGRVILNKSANSLVLINADLVPLTQAFYGKTYEERFEVLQVALDKLCDDLDISTQLKNYAEKSLPVIVMNINNALKLKMTEKVFIPSI